MNQTETTLSTQKILSIAGLVLFGSLALWLFGSNIKIQMLEVISLIILGAGIGAYGTMVGIGGGPLLVPVFLLVYKMAPVNVVATSLCVIFFNVFSGTLAYSQFKRIDTVSGVKFGIAAIPGAMLGSFLLPFISVRFFELILGTLFLLLSCYIIAELILAFTLKKTMKELRGMQLRNISVDFFKSWKRTDRIIVDHNNKNYFYKVNEKLGIIVTSIVGFIAPIIGTGGGTLHVPLLNKVLGFPIHIATATATFQLMIVVLFALVPYISMDAIDYHIALPTAIGTLFGARLGATYSNKISEEKLFLALAVVLSILSIRLLLLSIG
ncbi:MAG: sulfite exporter TauE/SafE family protein [Fibrobacteria bacterium]|nr:sulfite exporter TauE/SafE family protein [Fibrobacteria bacterium]